MDPRKITRAIFGQEERAARYCNAAHIGPRAAGAGAAAAMLLLSGCATIDPYWRPKVLNAPSAGNNFAGDLGAAIDYAHNWQARYYRNAGQEALVHNSALLAIPFGGAALFNASTGKSASHSVTAFGIAGATLYLVATNLSSTPRQRIYMAGSVTLSCAIDAMYPYVMTKSEFAIFTTALDSLGPEIAAIQPKIRDAKSALDALKATQGVPFVDLVSSGTDAVSSAQTAVERAQKSLADGYVLSNQVETSGVKLDSAVEKIISLVGDQIALTQVDLQSLAGIVSGLGATAASFRPSPPAAGAPATANALHAGGGSAESRALDTALSSLNSELDKLTVSTNLVAARVNAVAAASAATTSAGKPGACEVTPVDTGFRVDPDLTSITLGPGESRRFIVSSGTGLPRANLVGPTDLGAHLTAGQNDGSWTLTTDAKTKAGDVQLVFADGTGHNRKVIAVSLTGSAAGSGTPPPAQQQSDKLPPDPGLSVDDMKTVQHVLNADGASIMEDGRWGDQTFKALRDYQKRHGLEQTGTLTAETKARLIPVAVQPAVPANPAAPPNPATPAVPSGAKNDFERSMKPEGISAVRKAFGLPPEGGFDEALRAKIKAFVPATPVADRPKNLDELSPTLTTLILSAKPK